MHTKFQLHEIVTLRKIAALTLESEDLLSVKQNLELDETVQMRAILGAERRFSKIDGMWDVIDDDRIDAAFQVVFGEIAEMKRKRKERAYNRKMHAIYRARFIARERARVAHMIAA